MEEWNGKGKEVSLAGGQEARSRRDCEARLRPSCPGGNVKALEEHDRIRILEESCLAALCTERTGGVGGQEEN